MQAVLILLVLCFLFDGLINPSIKSILSSFGLPSTSGAVVITCVVIFLFLSVISSIVRERNEAKRKEREYEKELRIRKKVERKFQNK